MLAPAVTQGNIFPVHQELLVKNGIRIGEAIRTEELAADGTYEFVYVTTPQRARGATAGNAPPRRWPPYGPDRPSHSPPRPRSGWGQAAVGSAV